MSKKSKTRNSEMRKKAKASRRSAMQAQYKAWADSGQNSKSKRATANAKANKRKPTIRHAVAWCGNVGCQKCSALYAVGGPLHDHPWWSKVRIAKEIAMIKQVRSIEKQRLQITAAR